MNQGDINNDNVVNVIDITLGICVILNNSSDSCNAECGWDVIDIILMVDIFINL